MSAIPETCEIVTNAAAAADIPIYHHALSQSGSAIVDLVVPTADQSEYIFEEGVDFTSLLAAHRKAIVFAVPGAFTPTCSSKHLPGFIAAAQSLYEEHNVERIYCLSVNDRYVMRAWAEATPNSLTSRIHFVADGNAAFTKLLHADMDRVSGRMGTRSQRYVMVLRDGQISHFFKDLSGFNETSAEAIRKHL